ncbi:hypothetical protein [Alcanivorax sp.]|uniref:hypothetical protein n=1 Tax=Alcanivorax sp. TaxID=1872427 RepID=UPI002588AF4E|nr:hypothetical protein [Alcanivorax sp.]
MKGLLSRLFGRRERHHSNQDHLANMPPEFFMHDSTQIILESSSIPEAVQSELAEALIETNSQPLRKAAEAALDIIQNDFDWPWLDHWITVANESSSWPQGYGWDVLAEPEPVASLETYLESLRKPELLALTKELGIKGCSRMKVGDIRAVLMNRLASDTSPVAQAMHAFQAELAEKRRLLLFRTKVEMLVHSIQLRAYNMHRAKQVASLLSHDASKFRVYIHSLFEGEFERRLYQQWRFDPDNPASLPPLYPGAHGSIMTENLRLKSRRGAGNR